MERMKGILSGAVLMAMAVSGAAAQQAAKGHWAIVVHGGAGDDRTLRAGRRGGGVSRVARKSRGGRSRGAGPGRNGAGRGGGDDPGSGRRSAVQCGAGCGVYLSGQERDGLGDHGRRDAAGGRGGRCVEGAAPDQPGARGDGEIAVRDDDRPGGRRVCSAQAGWSRNRPATSLPRPLAVAGEAVAEGGQTDSAAAGGRAAAEATVVPVAQIEETPDAHRYGTVGVVALDRQGNIAAGTSTGGLQGKMPGRVGDSPIIGAGTYASNQSCAVSATGSGEYFIRLGVTREVCSLVQYKGMRLQQAADEVIHTELPAIHGDGGRDCDYARRADGVELQHAGDVPRRQAEGGKVRSYLQRRAVATCGGAAGACAPRGSMAFILATEKSRKDAAACGVAAGVAILWRGSQAGRTNPLLECPPWKPSSTICRRAAFRRLVQHSA